MKKLTFLFICLFSTSAFATSEDCEKASPMVSPTVHLVVQALRMHKDNADYKAIAQWRVNTFNPQIDKIISANELQPKDMVNPDLEITRDVYNEVMMRSKIYVNQVYSYSRGGADKSSVDEQRIMINDAVQRFKAACVTQ
ncbi:hypothetical protein [Vibrio fluvialis]|uniref:hypothetical protein n=1 Tax=Vibrio fluvialis TaxID=676 RepID=UPI0023A9DC6C|nr:hypothetical protein [Vibrio fluvialis]MDE5178235.1 hypothetical protein [Vibrio fluvialis]